MDAGADDRLRSAALVGVALAALAVGGWWWLAAAPAPTAQPAPTPTVRLDEIGPNGTPAGAPDVRRTVQVDTRSGEIVREGESSTVRIDPETGMITDVEGTPGDFFYQGDPSGGLPLFKETIWRERSELTPGKSVIRQSAAVDGGRYLLQYRCTRPGAMLLVVTGARLTEPSQIDCDGTVGTAELNAIGGPIRVSLSTAGEEPVDAEAQFVELP
ncbi:hypothetical protein [Micromonospora cremea]|uniref:Uncharacterized protein n=1 Tax=Micromonospora cremea TaxID=709881 RepID=A0A1N5ZSJ3_9ACTN|nr:hypothetical protein [Micromonospora cremea]SIN24728.1 hypothetical protein SAMN04489832_4369 [Micromonospora cremea]